MIRDFTSRVEVLRNGVVYTRLQYDQPPNIYADSTGKIKTSLFGFFVANDAVDWLSDELRPVLVLNGVEYPFGVFRAAAVSKLINESGAMDKVEAYDRTYLLQQRRTESILHFSAGTNYITVVESLLVDCGIVLKVSTPTEYTLATTREDWDVGTSYLDIVNQLLGEINYRDIWFNADGIAVLEPKREVSADRIDHVYDASKLHTVLQRDYTVETDLFDKPNVFVVVCSNPDLAAPMTAVAVNDSPNSAFSVTRRGMRVTKLVRVDNIAGQDALQTYADTLCRESMLTSEVITIQTAAMPGHGIGDTVALVHPTVQGLCEETAWYLELSPGSIMTHKLKRVVYK